MSLTLLTSTHLIAQHNILPRNLRKRDESGIRPYLCRRPLLKGGAPWRDLGADRLEGWG
ncbi:hypothetical protein HNR55_002623 [Acetobacter lovaniensis]|uniref:Uncharacterized protein n=1 Tax=Acetobacter lovaniensis TaxID=104100 RepID=A0A841QG61_9PROT|nr:hypothetical protein [Acetobacter lovaniensis]